MSDRTLTDDLYRRIRLAARYFWYRLHSGARQAITVDDLTQEGAWRVLRSIPRYEKAPGVPFDAWVLVEARNGMMDYARNVYRTRVFDQVVLEDGRELRFDAPGPAEQAEQAEATRALVDALARLPGPDKELASLVLYRGMTPTEAGEYLKRSGWSNDRARISKRMAGVVETLGRVVR